MSNLVEDMKDAFADLQNPEDSTMPEGWDSDKVKPIDSEDGVVVPVPIGYTASSAKDENTVNGGFVIYEGNDVVTDSNVEDAKKNRNQFVWVPVDDIDEIAKVAKDGGTDSNGRINYQGKLYDFSTNGATEKENYGQGTTSYREPDIVNEDYTDYYEYVKTILGLDDGNALKTQLQEEFNEMVASVKTYGGFYIGRYETGNLASNTTEPVVIKENASISDVNWYYIYQNSK